MQLNKKHWGLYTPRQDWLYRASWQATKNNYVSGVPIWGYGHQFRAVLELTSHITLRDMKGTDAITSTFVGGKLAQQSAKQTQYKKQYMEVNMREVKTKADISRVGLDEDLGIWIVPKRGKWIYIDAEFAEDIVYHYLKIKHKKEESSL